MSTANAIECIEELVGEKLTGVIEEWASSDITSCKALVFESGRALVLGDNGSYWVAPVEEVQRVVARLRERYERATGRHARLLKLAGASRTVPAQDSEEKPE